MNINGKVYLFEFGVTNDGYQKAKHDAKIRLFDFVEKL